MSKLNHSPVNATAVPGGASPAPSQDHGKTMRLGVWALLLGFGGFMLWAAYAPLDEGVPSPGMVAISTKRKTVQHPIGGIVKEVLVHEGQQVKEGDVLIRLDDAQSRFNFEAVRQRYLGLRAMQGRLLAEQAERSTVQFHPDLVAASVDPLIKQQMQTQVQLFTARRAALQADVSALGESIRAQESALATTKELLQGRRQQLSLLNEELTHTRSLVQEGYAPRNRQLELERNVADLQVALSDLSGRLQTATIAIAQLRQQILSKQKEYRKEVESNLADVTREVEADESKMVAATNELARTQIKSPASGQVLGLAMQTAGGVIQAGQRLMDIVPVGEELLLEAHVPPQFIDRIQDGMDVDVRFSAFAHTPHLVVHGQVVSVSRDLITDPELRTSYYLARVQVTPEGMKTLGDRRMQPGMPGEMVFKTGERSLLTYLLHPLTKRMAASLKEE